MNLTRRNFILGAAVLVLGAGAFGAYQSLKWPQLKQRAAIGEAQAQSKVDTAELLKPPTLGERSLGAADAKVTIVEYASSTCPHCAKFYVDNFEALKKDYIDTGKVRFIFREFPLNDVDLAAFMLARCAPEDKYFPLIHIYFEQQQTWTKGNPRDELFKIAKLAGFTQESFDVCLKDEKIAKGLLENRDQAEKLGVESTPTFFINGEILRGAESIEEFRKLIDAALAA
ncbi:MAG TPA: DsbA family protein [Aestuariivirgaceae bacterium]|jgi:protein-disulfide isomerase